MNKLKKQTKIPGRQNIFTHDGLLSWLDIGTSQ